MSNKFRVKMKLQGFELEIEGTREDAGLISKNIGQQFANIIKPIDGIIEGSDYVDQPKSPPVTLIAEPAKAARRRRTASPSKPANDDSGVVEFLHASEKYGNPQQAWNTADKSIWFLYALKAQTGRDSFSVREIANTFNHHFKSSGVVKNSNVSRDLGKARAKEKPAPIGYDPTKELWFLTEEGHRRAQALVAQALTPTS